jgi:hypothetical protein
MEEPLERCAARPSVQSAGGPWNVPPLPCSNALNWGGGRLLYAGGRDLEGGAPAQDSRESPVTHVARV